MSRPSSRLRFADLRSNDLPELLRDLQRAETPEDWREVLARAVDELAYCHFARPRDCDPPERHREWTLARIKLAEVIRAGFAPPPRRAREVFRAERDARDIAVFGKCRTQAEAVDFLMFARGITREAARSRVRRAMKAGLVLEAAPRFGRKPPTKDR
ncbi:hypothetical protein [Rubritepida flocculans]|uniref:hypothetical protein n=1 Tax=Rubritepida flocculans TaxID=182403 RepID=UPI0004176C1F|nr:hypothetical protein [Rubritepida flocculans]